jgi:hypothetical protein
VILGPAVFRYWIVYLQSSSIFGCFGPLTVPGQYNWWFFPKIIFKGFFGYKYNNTNAVKSTQ